jgi:dipeptidyl aminopeptidase/acylaminoacyl peptidase
MRQPARLPDGGHPARCAEGATVAPARALGTAAVMGLGVLLAFSPDPAAAQQQFTLEQVLSAPFPTDLVSASKGNAFLWVQDERGHRNLWIAAGPDYRGRQVTSYDQDDGQELSDEQLTSDGASIVYVHGGAPNRAGEIPNPTSDPDGETRAVWTVSAAGGAAPKEIGEGYGPAVSPRGDVVAFLRHGEIWTAPLDGSAKPSQLLHTRGGAGDLTWSPDGSQLAFVSNRGDHSFIGIFDPASRKLVWLDPSTDHDRSPVWSPDGKRIAYIRVPNEREELPFFAHRTALPWTIHVADPATGEARLVWRADDGPGSAFASNDEGGRIFWAAGDRIVFPWEKTGWLHLWSVPATGGTAVDLTPGEFEIQHVDLTPDRRELIYSSNQATADPKDADRRHLWRVPVTGATKPVAVTSGTGLEWSPVSSADGNAVAFLASDPRQPAHAEIMVGGGARRPLVAGWLPADFPTKALVVPQQVIFSASDGLRIHGQLFLPADLKPNDKRPAVVFFHGGSRRQMLLGWHYMYYYSNAYGMNQYLANHGYIVLSVNYRSGIGYGLNFREATDYGAGGASEYRDVMGAGLYLRSRADVDPDRIGVWGGSYGGYLTAMALSRSSDLFAAGVDLHGVHDWNIVIDNFHPSYDPAALPDVAKLAFQSSPLATVVTWRSPVLLIQGDDDRNVPFRETVDLAETLRKLGVHVEQLVFPDEVHDFLLERNWLAAYHAAADFFQRMLQQGGAARLRASAGASQR